MIMIDTVDGEVWEQELIVSIDNEWYDQQGSS